MDPEHTNTQHAQAVLETKDPNSLDESYEIHVYGATLLQPEGDVLSVTDYRLYKRRWIGLGALPVPIPKCFIRADRFRLAVMALLNMVSAANWIWFSPIASASQCTFRVYGPLISHPAFQPVPSSTFPSPRSIGWRTV